jgi:Na+/H+ antiporter NhaC
MLEKLSPQLRHAVVALLGSALTLGVGYIHSLHFSAPVQALVGSVVAAIVLVVTPLTNQYGVAELNPDGTPKTPTA